VIDGVGIFHSNLSCHNNGKHTLGGSDCQVSRVDPRTCEAQDVLNIESGIAR
jgi:hypothetical protein